MSGTKETYYWDSCIWIAHFKAEERNDPLDLQGIQEQVNLFEQGQIDIATSVVTLAEVLDNEAAPDSREQLRDLLKRRNIHSIQVDRRIAEIASEVRMQYNIKTPDAIHLASSIAFSCNRFMTFDEVLLALPNPLLGQFQVNVQKPVPGQLTFLAPPS